MANARKQKVTPVRVPPHAAAGLDDELTARPKPPSDELSVTGGDEAGLSVEPEDLGKRWLSQATEQGEAVPQPRLESVVNLTTGPSTDEAPSFAQVGTVWEQTVDRVTETQGAAVRVEQAPDPDTRRRRDLLRTQAATQRADAATRMNHVVSALSPAVRARLGQLCELSLQAARSALLKLAQALRRIATPRHEPS